MVTAQWCSMAELIFERTCNYWMDAGIVGLYDTLKKPVPSQKSIGDWNETIQSHTSVSTELTNKALVINGEERNIDSALSSALEWIRTTLYDVSSEPQIAREGGIYYNPKEGIVYFAKVKPIPTAELVIESPRQTQKADAKKLPPKVYKNLKDAGGIKKSKKKQQETYLTAKNSCFPQFLIANEHLTFFKQDGKSTDNLCVTCLRQIFTHKNDEVKEWFSGEAKNFMPFVEGKEANRTFHSKFRMSEKCWRCGLVTLFAPLLVFFRCDNKDTYFALPYVPGNLEATHTLFRSLTGKRGLARVLGSDHFQYNYESAFKQMPKGQSVFTMALYYDLYDRLLPKTSRNLFQASKQLGIVDDRGAVFQTALFLNRDSGQQKSFILRETTIDRSAYFIKLFGHLKAKMDLVKKGAKCVDGLWALFGGASGNGSHLQRLSVLRAAEAFTGGRHVYRFLLPILSSDVRDDSANPCERFQITALFQVYDQWLFRKEDVTMANLVELAKNSGFHLSREYWKQTDLNDDEKKNLLKRYYYGIERAPSPVKFLEQARHAYHKVGKEMPKEMVFHEADGKEDVKSFEVYRVYFLAGMLNGMLKKSNVQSPPQSNETSPDVASGQED